MRVAKKVLGLALVGTLALAGAASAQLIDKKTISLAAAKKIAGGGEAEAAKNNWKMVIAIGKAHTALALRRSTKAVEDIIAGGRTAFLGVRGLTPIQGGLPIIVDGKVVGAVGASGGTSAQDEQVAKAGIDAMMK